MIQTKCISVIAGCTVAAAAAIASSLGYVSSTTLAATNLMVVVAIGVIWAAASSKRDCAMIKTATDGIDWFVGSNGNLFGDSKGFRYCIARLASGEYIVARDGVE